MLPIFVSSVSYSLFDIEQRAPKKTMLFENIENIFNGDTLCKH